MAEGNKLKKPLAVQEFEFDVKKQITTGVFELDLIEVMGNTHRALSLHFNIGYYCQSHRRSVRNIMGSLYSSFRGRLRETNSMRSRVKK